MSNQPRDFPSIVKLNVGGQHFTTSLQTLTRDPNSMLAAMFSGRHEVQTTEDGSFFIDRDGTYFRFLLNYLRNGELILPDGATFLKELEAEAKFYQLQGILDELHELHELHRTAPKELKEFEESVILTNEEHRRVLKTWLPIKSEWRLLFRASRDGFAALAFHSKCDNKGPTVTVVKSGGNIFGGFTGNAWKSPTDSEWVHMPCCNAFLFSIVNPSGREPTKLSQFPQHKPSPGIFCDSTCGPAFGSEFRELLISDNANTRSSRGRPGNAYQSPSGPFFTGEEYFTVTDYEVFGLCQ